MCIRDRKNCAQANFDIYTIYKNGTDGLQPDLEKASQYLDAAAKSNFAEALLVKAQALEDADGIAYNNIEQNDAKALEWYQKAEVRQQGRCAYRLGMAYEHAELGLEKNEETAFQYYQKAADGGHKDAQCLIGIIYEDGSQESEEKWRKEKNGAKALEYYQKAAGGGHAYAQKRLGDAYEDGMFGLEVDEVAAFEYYKKAADGGDNDAAQYEIGCAYENGELGTRNSDIPWKLDCEIRAAKAMEYYHKAADSGHTYAQYILGFHYETGLTKELSLIHI